MLSLQMFPAMKFLVVLRNPIDRAVSEYYMEYRRIESQSEFISKVIPELQSILDCYEKEPRRLRRRGQGGGPGGMGGMHHRMFALSAMTPT